MSKTLILLLLAITISIVIVLFVSTPKSISELSVDTRKEIYQKVIAGYEVSANKSYEKYPKLHLSGEGIFEKNFADQLNIQKKLQHEHDKNLAKSYGITLHDIDAIIKEATTKRWDMGIPQEEITN